MRTRIIENKNKKYRFSVLAPTIKALEEDEEEQAKEEVRTPAPQTPAPRMRQARSPAFYSMSTPSSITSTPSADEFIKKLDALNVSWLTGCTTVASPEIYTIMRMR